MLYPPELPGQVQHDNQVYENYHLGRSGGLPSQRRIKNPDAWYGPVRPRGKSGIHITQGLRTAQLCVLSRYRPRLIHM